MKKKILTLIIMLVILLSVLLTTFCTVQIRELVGNSANFKASVVYGSNEQIKIFLEGKDTNYASYSLTNSNLVVKVGGTRVTPSGFAQSTTTASGVVLLITLTNVTEIGQITLEIPAGTLTDTKGVTNDATTIATEMYVSAPLASKITAANYGDPVDYSANGISDWKIFYKDSNYVYIIASTSIPWDKRPAGAGMTNYSTAFYHYWSSVPSAKQSFTNEFMTTGYDLSSHDSSNTRCVTTLLNTSNWSTFASGTSGANSITGTAIGGPTLEMWVASYNGKGSLNSWGTLYCNNKNDNGYYVGTSSAPTSKKVSLSSGSTGYDDTLYFPLKSSPGSYWLASPSADDSASLMRVGFNGTVYSYSYSTGNGLRPIVRLPSGMSTTGKSTSWNLTN